MLAFERRLTHIGYEHFSVVRRNLLLKKCWLKTSEPERVKMSTKEGVGELDVVFK